MVARRFVLAFVGVIAAVVVVAWVPRVLSPDRLDIATFIGLYTIVGVGLTLLMGFGGQVSLGQGGFFALGAYATGVLTVRAHWSAWLAALAAPLIAAAVGALIGLPLLRLRGHHLAVATLAVAIIVFTLANNLRDLTGGPVGLRIPRPHVGIGGPIVTPEQVYALVWIVAFAGLLLAGNLVRSRPGRALRALAQHEGAAESVGVNVPAYRLAVFALAAGFAGAAGGLYALYFRFLSPDSFKPALSILFLIIVAVGGLGNIAGALIGAATIEILTEVLKNLSTRPDMPARAPVVLQTMVYALVLIAIMRFLPRGLVPAIGDGLRRLFTRTPRAHPPTSPSPTGTPASSSAD